MAIIIGGPESGLLNSSLNQLGQGNTTSKSEVGHDERIWVNVTNGNLILGHEDTYLPSLGEDYQLLRTYNSRAVASDATQYNDARWSSTTSIRLEVLNSNGEKRYEVTYGDGSVFDYHLDPATGLYVSTDGDGAYETLEELQVKSSALIHFVVTRADQTRLSFDKLGFLVASEDTNGVRMEYTYKANRLIQVKDDEGHVINYNYASGILESVTDEKEGVLVEYRYSKGRLSEVIDRYGHSTKYFYTTDGFVNRILLPDEQEVAGQNQPATYAQREILFEYASVNWYSGTSGTAMVLTRMTDAEGNVTTFDYAFNLRDGGSETDKFYDGGSTTVTDALGNTLTYTYRADGYITRVVDQQGFATSYDYDEKGNLLSVTDRNGWGAVNSDSTYYRELRASLGEQYADAGGTGKLVSQLTETQKEQLLEAFTSHFTYDDRGNLLTSTDNSGNTTVYTYTVFNRIATIRAPEGGLTTLSYDARQNLVEIEDPSGDVTGFEYDSNGNQTRRIVYLDPTDLSKKQVTSYFYDLFGNNIKTIDAEGNETRNVYDHFGNLVEATDANGGVTRYVYDADNRLLSITDPEGHTSFSSYDAVGNRISFTDARGKTTTYIYDRNNRLITTLDPAAIDAAANRVTTRQYDLVGNQLTETDAEGRTTRYSYNARRELIEITTTEVAGEDGITGVRYNSTFAFDGEGNRITSTDNRGNSTEFLYTPTGLLQRETTAEGHVTQYSYDRNLNIISIAAGMQLAEARRQIIRFAYDSEDQVIRVTDAEGNVTRYGYDAPGTIASIVDAERRETNYLYDGNNRLIREIRPEVSVDGISTRYEVEYRYDGNGNVIETIDENGHSTHFEFDRDNRTVKITDANGVTTRFSYDPNDNLTRVTIGTPTEDARVTSYVYDEFNQLIAITDGVGNALATSDDPLYRRIRKELLGNAAEYLAGLTPAMQQQLRELYTEHFTYDRVGNQLLQKDHLGRETGFQYDALDRLVVRTDALGGTQQFRYDGNGNLVASFDERGMETTYRYDKVNRTTYSVNAAGGVTEFEYDAFDNLVSARETTGSVVQKSAFYVYDLNNQLLSESDALGRTKTYQYDAVGNRLKVTDARGHSTNYVYDALDRNIQVIDPKNFKVNFEYDGVGNQIKVIDPRNGETAFRFDFGNRLIELSDAEGRTTRYEYDALGNQITQTTGAGTGGSGSLGEEVTKFEYDAENNLRAVVNALGERTTYDLDSVYNQTAFTNGRGARSSAEFDALNRVISTWDGLGNVTRFTFDAAGNEVTRTDALARITTYAYDEINQLFKIKDPLGVETHYEDDAFGNAISITRAANMAGQERVQKFTYDSAGNLLKEEDPSGGIKTYEYDENSNVTAVIDEEGRRTEYVYNENNQLEEIKDALGGITRYAYDGNGNRISVTDAEDNTTTYYYNGNDEISFEVDALGFITSHEYDKNGNLVAITRHALPVAGLPVDPAVDPVLRPDSNDRTTRYAYDAMNQLIMREDPEQKRAYFAYDAVGNLKNLTDENGNTTHYDYDENDRQIAITDALAGVQGFAYDAVGNRISETDQNSHTTHYEYDANDRLKTMIDPLDKRSSFSYDAVGNVTEETDEKGIVTTFVYDLLDRLITRVNATGTDIEVEYNYKFDKVGNLLQLKIAGESIYENSYQYDALDRQKETVDGMGKSTRYEYDRVGNLTKQFDEINAETRLRYDALNRLIERQDALNGIRTLGYDAFGNQISEEDEAGVRTEFAYDKNDRLIKRTDDSGAFVTIEYDAAGNKKKQTDARGFVTEFFYDQLNRLTKQIDPLGYTQETAHDAVGNSVSVTDGRSNKAYAAYDANNRLVGHLSGEGYLTTFEYDEVGNETVRREYTHKYLLDGDQLPIPDGDDMPRETVSTYNELNQLTSQRDPGGVTTYYEYDGAGNPVRTSRSTGGAPGLKGSPGEKKVSYDDNGRVIERVDAAGVITRLELDAKGNVHRQIDAWGTPEERLTEFEYDPLNRLAKETNALGTVIEYTYNGADQLLSRTTSGPLNPVARIERFEYDRNGRLAAESNGVGNRTEYFYDPDGNLTRVEFGVTTPKTPGRYNNTFTYDKDGRLETETDGEGVTTKYEYDGNGNKTKTIQAFGHPDEPERVTEYSYDADNRLTSIIDPLGNVTTYAYNSEGNQYLITDANGTVTLNTFDSEGRILTNTVDATGPHGGVKTTNVYDVLTGNLLSTTVGFADEIDSSKLRTTSYEYDVLDRVIKVTDPEGFSTEFEYDSFGNQTLIRTGVYVGTNTAKLALAVPQETRFTYDAANQLIRTEDDLGNAVVSTYDNHGNRITQTSGIAPGASVESGATTTFRYDLDGKLIEKATEAGGLVEITRNILGEQTRIRTLQSDSAAGRVWVVEEFQYDSQGRVTDIKDSDGIVTHYEYDAVGNTVAVTRAHGTGAARTTTYVYDLDSNLIAEVDPMGGETRYEYDEMGNLTKKTDAEDYVTRYYYNGLNRLIGAVDAERYFVALESDAVGNVLSSTVYATRLDGVPGDILPVPVSSNADRVTTWVYDRNNQRISETFANGSSKEYLFDSVGRLRKQTEHASTNTDELARTTDQLARVLEWQWDTVGRLTGFINVDGVTETYTYDAAGNRISETVTPVTLATGDVEPVHLTTFTYDLGNRLRTLTTGTNTQTLSYDLAGNVIAKEDALGNVTTTAYDANNRIISVTNALEEKIEYRYDEVGNLIETTDARGFVSTYSYDLNDRLTAETTPSFEQFSQGDGSPASATATTRYVYDMLGNLVKTTDAEGYEITRWYNGTGQVSVEVDADRVLRKYSYNAHGELLSLTLHLDRLGEVEAGSLDPAVPPVGTGNTTLITNEYDLMGRIVSTTYPPVDIVALSGPDSAITVNRSTLEDPRELSRYDAFGNLVESVDRNGNSSFSFVDRRGRQIALIDAEGYVTKTAYDSQGNVVQQRKYEAKAIGVDAGGPILPSGSIVHVVDRTYDEQGRLISEVSPAVNTPDGEKRVKTVFVYDAAGNLTEKTRAAGTGQAQTETYYYDAAGRRTALVTSNRVLNTFRYDENGNLIRQKRYIERVADGVDLRGAGTTAASLEAGITKTPTADQTTEFAYNAINMLSSQTYVMGEPGGTDDIVSTFGYDAVGNMTRKVDGEGIVTEIGYDGAGRITLTASPNGGYSYVEYNVSGQKIKAWTGGAPGSQAPQVSNITPRIAAGSNSPLTVSWTPAGEDTTSWVAWSTTSHSDEVDPEHLPSMSPGSAGVYEHATTASAASTTLALEGVSPGSTIYFRVMTRDFANNLSWSQEQSVTVPTRIADLSVKPSGADFIVTVEFDGAVTDPKIQSAAFADKLLTHLSGNLYEVTLVGVSPLVSTNFSWQSNGETYTTSAAQLLIAGEHERNADSGYFQWSVPRDSEGPVGSGQLVVVNGVSELDWGDDPETDYAPDFDAERVNDRFQFNPPDGAGYDIYYGDHVDEKHDLDITFQDYQTYNLLAQQWVSDNNGLIRAEITARLDPAESSRIAGSLMVAYGTNGTFTSEQAMTGPGPNWTTNLNLAEAADSDLKIYYFDGDGHEVIVEWRRISVPAEFDVIVGLPGDPHWVEVADTALSWIAIPDIPGSQSLTVLASERGGQVNGSAIDEGIYSGPIDPASLSMALSLAAPAGNPGGRSADGFADKTYYTLIEYNALGAKIATNEFSGIWRTYGVDAMGNQLVTHVYGTEEAAAANPDNSIDSFAFFDKRNLEIKTVGPKTSAGAAVTETAYDYDSRIVSLREPGDSGSRTFAYDGVGNLISESDALGYITLYTYDRLGNLVWSQDPSGDTQHFNYSYSGATANRLISSFYTDLEGETDTYGYDSFGRRTSITNGLSETISVSYDQRGRISLVTDAMGYETRYFYDKRGNQTWVQDANGNFFGRAYNEMGQLTHEYSFTATPVDLADAQARVDSKDATLVDSQIVYDINSNRIATIDAEGRRKDVTYGAFSRVESDGDSTYSYDLFGRLTTRQLSGGTTIERSYDDAGHLTRVNDNGTATQTDYAYDVAGNRISEKLQINGTVQRDQSYVYNDRGELTSWTDSSPSTAITTTYTYSSDGNVASITGGGTTTDYTYDAADRVLSAGAETFTYDAAGRRKTTSTTEYTYNKNGWITRAEIAGLSSDPEAGDAWTNWTYDKVGNITKVETREYYEEEIDLNPLDNEPGELELLTRYKSTTNTYNASYLLVTSSVPGGNQVTTTSFDKTGRTLYTTVTRDKVEKNEDDEDVTTRSTVSYSYSYDDKGHLISITGSGEDVNTGSSTSSFDINGNLVQVSLGLATDQVVPETNTFSYDNDGKIVTATRFGGASVTRDEDGEVNGTNVKSTVTTHYLYALGNPVGEYVDSANPTINRGDYSLIKGISSGLFEGRAFPEASILQHTVAAGDSLRSLAGQYYGSPDLWFVIAEANGLTGIEQLQTGARLVIPNTVENGYQTAESHLLYKEGEIIGSKLPNLAAAPPAEEGSDNTCAIVGAIILIVVVAIAAIALTIVTVGAAAPAAGAAVAGAGTAAAIIIGVAVGAAIGAAIAFAASVITQGILIGFGLQEEFDWTAVAADTVAGAFGGAAAGLGSTVAAARAATTALKVINVAGQVALETSGELASQAIQNDGEITNGWLVAVAGAGGAFGAVGDAGARSVKAGKAGAKAGEAGAKASKSADEVLDAARAATSVDEIAITARSATKKSFDSGAFSAVAKSQFTDITGVKVSSSLAGKGKLTKTVVVPKLVDGEKSFELQQVIRNSARTAVKGKNTKTVRYIEDGVIKTRQVARESVAGTSRTARLKAAPRTALNAISNAPGKAWQGLNDLTGRTVTSTVKGSKGKLTKIQRVRETVDGQRVDSFQQVLRNSAGTVAKGKNTKTVRYIEDGVIKTRQVARESVAGTSKIAKLKAAPGAAVAKLKAAPGDAWRKSKQAISEFRQSGTVTKYKETKVVRSFRTAEDGSRIPVYSWVARQSVAGTSKTARLQKAASTGFTAAGDAATAAVYPFIHPQRTGRVVGKAAWEGAARAGNAAAEAINDAGVKLRDAGNAAVKSLNDRALKASTKAKNAYNTAVEAVKNPRVTIKNAYKSGALAKQAGKLEFGTDIAELFLRTEKEKKSSFSPSTGGRRGQLLKWTLVGPVFKYGPALAGAILRGTPMGSTSQTVVDQLGIESVDVGKLAANPPGADDAFLPKPRPEVDDRNARLTFSEAHGSQHSYLALDWVAVAANSTTRIFSPFTLDHVTPYERALMLNKLASGQVAEFDQETIVRFTERSVGGVEGVAINSPGTSVKDS